MSKELSPIEASDDGSLALRFSKKQFSDFVFTHIQTPSEETRDRDLGFDLTRNEIKGLIDKLIYVVNTNNDLIKSEFTAAVTTNEDSLRKINSYNDFFNIDNFEPKFLKKISITISFLISFKRSNEDAAPEKQMINIQFYSGNTGKVRAEIRATEFSWPNNIFDIINKEFNNLEADLLNKNKESSLFFVNIYKYLYKILKIFNQNILKITYLLAFLAFSIIAVDSVLLKFGQNQYIVEVGADAKKFTQSEIENQILNSEVRAKIQIYNSQTKTFEEQNLDKVLLSNDWIDIVEKTLATEFLMQKQKEIEALEKLRELLQAKEESTTENTYIQKLVLLSKTVPATIWFLGAIILSLAYFNIREMRRVKSNSEGRIWLSNLQMPNKNKLTSTEGAVESVFLSLISTIVIAAILHHFELVFK